MKRWESIRIQYNYTTHGDGDSIVGAFSCKVMTQNTLCDFYIYLFLCINDGSSCASYPPSTLLHYYIFYLISSFFIFFFKFPTTFIYQSYICV